MLSRINKVSAIGIICLVLLSGLAAITVASVQYGSSGKSAEQTTTITLYRYGPDGSITPVKVDIRITSGQDLGEAILEKCSELVDNDIEMLNYISGNGYTTNGSIWANISSWGKGLHWKSSFRFRIPLLVILRFKVFQDVPFRYKIFGINVIPWVHCNYMNDDNATTTIETLPTPSRPDKKTTVVEGRHNVTAFSFFGYTYWRGARAKWFDDSGTATGFDGYAIFTLVTQKNS